MSHFKAEMHQILFPASARPSVRLLDGVWHFTRLDVCSAITLISTYSVCFCVFSFLFIFLHFVYDCNIKQIVLFIQWHRSTATQEGP